MCANYLNNKGNYYCPSIYCVESALTLSEFSWPWVWKRGLPSGSTGGRPEYNFWNKCPCPFSRNLCWTFPGPLRTSYPEVPTVGRLWSPNCATWNIGGREGRQISFAELWSYCIQNQKWCLILCPRCIVVIKLYDINMSK